jgi:hypothetical protein
MRNSSYRPPPGQRARHVAQTRHRSSLVGRRATFGLVVTAVAMLAVMVTVLGVSGLQRLVGVSGSRFDARPMPAAATQPEFRARHGPALAGERPPAPKGDRAPPAGQAGSASSARVRSRAPRRGPPDMTGRWAGLLDRLDAVRAMAWSRGEPRLLRHVYTAPSAVLRRDRRALREYTSRGLHVRGVRLRFASVHVLVRRPSVLRLRVVDRLDPVVAQLASGALVRLPRDRPSRHTIVLRETGGRWRIAAIGTT